MIAIIGAGISGLTLAYFLEKKQIPYILLESSSKVGGYIHTVKKQPYLLELGPNSLLINKETEAFIDEIGLSNELLPANEVSKNRYIFRKGKYRVLPSSPPKLLFNSFFSLKTKWAIFRETRKKPLLIQNETLSQFFKRRFGKEVVKYALDPFVAGIYAGDPSLLLLEKTFPFLREYEQQ